MNKNPPQDPNIIDGLNEEEIQRWRQLQQQGNQLTMEIGEAFLGAVRRATVHEQLNQAFRAMVTSAAERAGIPGDMRYEVMNDGKFRLLATSQLNPPAPAPVADPEPEAESETEKSGDEEEEEAPPEQESADENEDKADENEEEEDEEDEEDEAPPEKEKDDEEQDEGEEAMASISRAKTSSKKRAAGSS